MFACRPLDVFDDLLDRALRCLSHRPLLSDYDEPEHSLSKYRYLDP